MFSKLLNRYIVEKNMDMILEKSGNNPKSSTGFIIARGETLMLVETDWGEAISIISTISIIISTSMEKNPWIDTSGGEKVWRRCRPLASSRTFKRRSPTIRARVRFWSTIPRGLNSSRTIFVNSRFWCILFGFEMVYHQIVKSYDI